MVPDVTQRLIRNIINDQFEREMQKFRDIIKWCPEYKSLIDTHIAVYKECHTSGLFYPENEHMLNSSEWNNQFDIRYQLVSVAGTRGELSSGALHRICFNDNVRFVNDYNEQCRRNVDLYLGRDEWANEYAVQVKSPTRSIFEGIALYWNWIKGEPSRLVIVNECGTKCLGIDVLQLGAWLLDLHEERTGETFEGDTIGKKLDKAAALYDDKPVIITSIDEISRNIKQKGSYGFYMLDNTGRIVR